MAKQGLKARDTFRAKELVTNITKEVDKAMNDFAAAEKAVAELDKKDRATYIRKLYILLSYKI